MAIAIWTVSQKPNSSTASSVNFFVSLSRYTITVQFVRNTWFVSILSRICFQSYRGHCQTKLSNWIKRSQILCLYYELKIYRDRWRNWRLLLLRSKYLPTFLIYVIYNFLCTYNIFDYKLLNITLFWIPFCIYILFISAWLRRNWICFYINYKHKS